MSNDPITIHDTATPYLQFIADSKPDWMRKALKSTGWMMQKEIKAGIRSGAPGGKKYSEFMPPAKRAQIEQVFGAKVRKAYISGGRAEQDGWGTKSRSALIEMGVKASSIGYMPLGKMSNAVGYQYDKNKNYVKVGWLSNAAVRLGKRIESGYNKEITDKMRRAFFTAGVPLNKSKSVFRVPARSTFGPMRTVLAPKIVPYIAGKIDEYAI